MEEAVLITNQKSILVQEFWSPNLVSIEQVRFWGSTGLKILSHHKLWFLVILHFLVCSACENYPKSEAWTCWQSYVITCPPLEFFAYKKNILLCWIGNKGPTDSKTSCFKFTSPGLCMKRLSVLPGWMFFSETSESRISLLLQLLCSLSIPQAFPSSWLQRCCCPF